MAAKNTSKSSSVEPKEISAEDILETLRGYASKSGVALKQSTVDAGGVYPVVSKDNGASVVTRLCLLTLTAMGKIKSPNDKVDAKIFAETLSSASFVPISGLVDKVLGNTTDETKWKNFSILRSRLTKEVRSGNTIAFKVSEPIDGFAEKWMPEVKKILEPAEKAPAKKTTKK